MADDVDPLPLGGEDSPWAHDVPVAEPSPLPAAWETARQQAADAVWPGEPDPTSPTMHDGPLGSDGDEAPATAPTPPSRHRRAVLVAGFVGLLAAAAVGSQLVGSDDRGSDLTTDTSGPEASVTTDTVADDDEPITTVRERPRTRTSTTVGDVLPEPAPHWELASVAMNPRMSALAVPTELIALSNDGYLHLVDVATGSIRSIDTEFPTSDVMLGIGSHAVAIASYNRSDLLLARAGDQPSSIDVPGGVSQVVARPGTDEFIVVPNMFDPVSPSLVRIGSDDRAARLVDGPLLDVNPWEMRFLPATGELIVNDSGGVYVVDETGQAARVSTGDLALLGANHYLVRECGETRECDYVRIDQRTGERVVVDLAGGRFTTNPPYTDVSSAGLSPDGSAISYFDWTATDGLPSRRLLDLATGTDIEVAPSDQYGQPGWAPDGSGLFVVDGRGIAFFDRATGELTHIAPDSVIDSGIVAVAVRPVSG